MAKAQPEQIIHRAIAEYLALTCNRAGFYYSTFPGGGLRSKIEARIFKGLGVKPGVADIMIVGPGGKVYWLEVKTPKTATTKKTLQSPVQKEFQAAMGVLDSPYAVVRSVDEAAETLKQWGVING